MASVTKIMTDVAEELGKAIDKFPSFHSAHEAFAVLKEEVDELWEAVRLKQSDIGRGDKIIKEATQVAAMAIRFIIDIEGFKN